MGTTGGDGGGDSVDSSQLLLVGICISGLVAAAFLAPVVGANNLLKPGGNGSLDDRQDSEPRDPEPEDSRRTVVERPATRGPGNGGAPGGDDGIVVGTYSGCFVFVEPDPKPGRNTSVLVTVAGEAAPDVPVWFNDEFVGRTDDTGSVTGTVPFVTELNVTVESPIDEPCRFSRRDPDDVDESGVVGAGVASAGSPGAGVVPSGPSGAGVTSAGPSEKPVGSPPPLFQQGGPEGVNNSTQYDVASNVSIRVGGDPVPGSNVTLVATVGGVAMPGAVVTVDGSQVGRTDGNGRYELLVPDRDSVEVTVSRGEISGTTTIDVSQLSVRFVPRLVVPGERATVVVTRGGEPVENTTVALDGAGLGTTGPNGTVPFTLPLSTSGTVTATVGPQSASVPLWQAYWLTAVSTLLLAVLTAVTTPIAGRLRGRGAAKRVAFVWAGVWTLFVGYVVGEGVGLAVAAAAVVLVALYRYRRAIASGGATTAGLVAGFVEWCSRAVLWVVGALESLADWARAGAGRLAAWLRSLPTSLSGLAAWLRTLPARLAAGVRSLPLRGVAAVVGGLALVAAATYAYEGVGFLAATGLVVLAAAGWWLAGREASAPSDGDTAETVTDSEVSSHEPSVPTLRQLWRRLASWVLPGTWQTRTPAEVSRAAIERGLPREPVETLTEAFRDVEYGGRSEERQQARAETAYEALESHRDSEGAEK